MDHKPVSQVIADLAATSSRNDKEAILKQNEDNDLLKKMFELVLNPYVNFFIKKIPQTLPESINEDELNKDLDVTEEVIIGFLYGEAFGEINRTSLKEGVAALNFLCEDEEVRELLRKILAKDISCGVAASTVNKVWEGLIPKYDVMKAEEEKHLSGITYPAIVDEKLDGARATAFITPAGEVEIKSSSGKTFLSLDHVEEELAEFYSKIKDSHYDGCVVDGELLAYKDGVFIGREKSNGMAYKALLGTISDDDKLTIKFHVFDLLSSVRQIEQGFDSRKLIDRRDPFLKLEGLKYVKEVDSRYVENEDAAWSFFNKVVAKGGEGVIVKNENSGYRTKRSKDWVKLKKNYEADAIITDATEHTKKKGLLGSMKIESSDGRVVGKVGTKMSDKVRKELWEKYTNGELLGSIATVQFMELGTSKDQRSFYLPRYIELRFDKDVADDLEKIEAMM